MRSERLLLDVLDQSSNRNGWGRRISTRMTAPVSHHARSLRKGFAAQIALVRPFSGVGQNVGPLAAHAFEGLLADRTHVGPNLAVLYRRVVRQTPPVLELQTALGALDAAFVHQQVIAEIVLRSKRVFAYGASELAALGPVLSLVRVHGHAGLEGLAAYLTDHRRMFGVVVTYVVRQVALDLKLLTALVARELVLVVVVLADLMVLQGQFRPTPKLADVAGVAKRCVVRQHVLLLVTRGLE